MATGKHGVFAVTVPLMNQ